MLVDSLLAFTATTGQAVTASAASTNVVDLGATGTPKPGHTTALIRDIGIGTSIPIRVQVLENFATLTSLAVSVQTDTTDAFSSAATVASTQAIPVASLLAGYVFNLTEIPHGTLERYLRLYFTVAGSNATAGKVFAAITMGNQYGHPVG